MRLAGLMQGVACGAASNAIRVPAADNMPSKLLGPVVAPTQFSSHGRWHGRIRKPYRASRMVKPHFKCVALNTQGLNWRLLAHAHKLRALIQQARSLNWSMVMLSDLHTCAEDWQDETTCKPQVVYIEEFVFIQWHRVGFLLDSPTRQTWETSGRIYKHLGQRAFIIGLKWREHTYHFGAVYAPVQSERHLRRQFFADLTTLIRPLPRNHLLLGGDWNGHLGQDAGPHGLHQPTTAGGQDVLLFLELHAYLVNLDHQFLVRNRGTWRHTLNRKFYELDYFIGTLDMKKMTQHMRVQPFPYSDHLAKMACFHLVTGSQADWRGRRFLQAARYSSQPQLDMEAIRGPSPEAQNLRAQLRSHMDRLLQPLLPQIHFCPTQQNVNIHLFVDGSYLDKGSFDNNAVAGWGVWIPEANLTFHGPVYTQRRHEMWIGADKRTNNTGELSAMIMALIWLWQSDFTGEAIIAYDSTYACNCAQGHWLPRTNTQLASTAQEWLQRCQAKMVISFRHVKSHTGHQDFWSLNNDIVDSAAKDGATGKLQLFEGASTLIHEPPPLPTMPTMPWPELAGLCKTVMDECIPLRKPHQRAVPYTASALEELDRRKTHLQELQTAFHQARRGADEQERYMEVKRYKRSLQQWARRQRAQWVAQLCKKLDAAMRLHDTRQFYHHLRALGVHIKGKSFEGSVPFGLEEATKFIEAVGNEPFVLPPNMQELLPPQQEVAWELDTTPTEMEVLSALGKMRDAKGGTDGITVGCIRAMGPWFQRLVAKTIQNLWNTEPATWEDTIHEVVGVLLYKKGPRDDPGNYRCIQLINVISRLLAKVVDGRIQRFSESRNLLPNQQYGFRKHRSTIGPIMLVRLIAETFRAHPSTDHHPLLLLIDIRKAYPRVPRSLAWQLFDRLGMPPMLTRVLHGLHDRAVYRIKTGAGLGRTYTNSRGFREGCPSSPACFNLYHTFPLQQFAKERRRQQGTAALRGGVNYNTRFDKVRRPRNVTDENINFELDDVLFADDTTIFTTVEQHLTDEQHLRQVLGLWGEDLHAGKTERLPLGLSLEEAARQAGVDPETLKDEARFLGAWITNEASQSVDTEKRLQRGKQLWTKLWKQAYRLTLPPRIMGMLFESTVMATMLYSAEARAFTKPEIRRMQTFVNRCTLGMLNVKQRHMHDDKVTMVDLRRKLGIPSIAVAIGIRQLRWLGHVARLDDTRLEKQALWLWHEHHGPGRRSRRKRCRGTNDTSTGLWSLLQDFKTTLDIPSTTWDTDWVHRAQTEDGKLWRSDIRKWQQRKEAAEDNDLWRVRHAPGGKAETQAQQRARRKAELANLTQQGDDLFLCPHCNDPFAANRIWMHARSCALLTPAQQLNAREARLQRQRRLQAMHAPLRDPVQAPHVQPQHNRLGHRVWFSVEFEARHLPRLVLPWLPHRNLLLPRQRMHHDVLADKLVKLGKRRKAAANEETASRTYPLGGKEILSCLLGCANGVVPLCQKEPSRTTRSSARICPTMFGYEAFAWLEKDFKVKSNATNVERPSWKLEDVPVMLTNAANAESRRVSRSTLVNFMYYLLWLKVKSAVESMQRRPVFRSWSKRPLLAETSSAPSSPRTPTMRSRKMSYRRRAMTRLLDNYVHSVANVQVADNKNAGVCAGDAKNALPAHVLF